MENAEDEIRKKLRRDMAREGGYARAKKLTQQRIEEISSNAGKASGVSRRQKSKSKNVKKAKVAK